MVHPVNRSGTGLQPHLLTLAELLKTCGEEVTEEMSSVSAADIEIFLEGRLAYHDLRRYKGTLDTDADDRWSYTLTERERRGRVRVRDRRGGQSYEDGIGQMSRAPQWG